MALDTNTMKARLAMTQKRAELILASAEREARALGDEEKKDLTALEQEIDSLSSRIERAESDHALNAEFEKITRGGGAPSSSARRPSGHAGGTWGDQFLVATSEFFKAGGHRTRGAWTSPAAVIPLSATTLTEDPASGGGLVQPDLVPGIIALPQRPLRVADVFAVGQTASNTLRLMLEKSWSNAAAPVLEGGVKPESALVFEQVDEPVRKVATWLPTSEELLEDQPSARSFVDARLRLGVQLAEDDQLLNGNGTAPNLLGVLNRPGLTATITQTTDTIADVIGAQISAVAIASNLAPDAVVINPSDWTRLATAKDSQGRYLASGAPFITMAPPMIWGVPAVITPAIVAKTVLVAAGKMGAQVFRHVSGLRVDASNSHQDFFIRNEVAIRAEERLALAVYRPSAFGKVVLA
jgi:HK97 family phage major capsid protein